MIILIDNKNLITANNIYSVFQCSYKVEAKLLNAKDFPPLKRTAEDFLKSNSDFYGYFKNKQLTSVIELIKYNKHIQIRSLVVDPKFFRQGIASDLIEFTFDNFKTDLFVVETGLKNTPAINLYKKYGFVPVKEWDTNHGVRKVKFEKQIS